MTTAVIVVLASLAIVVVVVRLARVRNTLRRILDEQPVMTATAPPTHVVLWRCGHRETRQCDPGCRHSDEPLPSIMRCGDCIWKEAC